MYGDSDESFETEGPDSEKKNEKEEDEFKGLTLGERILKEAEKRKAERSQPKSLRGLRKSPGAPKKRKDDIGKKEGDPTKLSPEGIVEEARSPFMKCMSDSCENQTTRNSGYCQKCEEELGPYLTRELLRCANCPVRPTCPEGQNKYGVCLYELDFDRDKVKQKEEIEKKMLEILHRNEKMVNRFFILLNALNLNSEDGRKQFSQISKDYKQWQAQYH